MSYYYEYFCGYELNGKIYPLGPFSLKGNLCPVLSISRSFASGLHNEFKILDKDNFSDELKKFFSEEFNEEFLEVKYEYLSNLSTESFIKKGFFLIKDIEAYERGCKDDLDLFCNKLSPEVYAARLKNEMLFGGRNSKRKDDDEEDDEHDISEYMYYMYPDYCCKEYEISVIRQAFDMLQNLSENFIENAKFVVIETEG